MGGTLGWDGGQSLRPRPGNPPPLGPPQSRGGAAPRRPAGETLNLDQGPGRGLTHRGRDETHQEKFV